MPLVFICLCSPDFQTGKVKKFKRSLAMGTTVIPMPTLRVLCMVSIPHWLSLIHFGCVVFKLRIYLVWNQAPKKGTIPKDTSRMCK